MKTQEMKEMEYERRGGSHSFGLMDDEPWSSIATMIIKEKRRNRRRE